MHGGLDVVTADFGILLALLKQLEILWICSEIEVCVLFVEIHAEILLKNSNTEN